MPVFLLTHLKLVGYAIALVALLGVLGWIGHMRRELVEQQNTIAVQVQQFATAAQVNAENIAEMARYKAEVEKEQAAVAQDTQRTTDTAAKIAAIHAEISHVAPKAGPAPAVGPYTATAISRLRGIKAAAGAHQDPGRASANPAVAPVVPGGP